MNRPDYVLVVEDDEGVGEVISTILVDDGYEAVCARSAEEALQLLQDRQPGVILLDLSVAGSHLDELVTAYRRIPNGTAPIIVVSGHPCAGHLAHTIGADRYLEKPFDIVVLLDTVAEALER